MTERAVDDTQWHLDKRIPITLILAIVIQTFSFGWMAKSIDAKAERNRESIAAINRELELRRPVIENNATSVAVMNQRLASIEASQQRILNSLERIEKQQGER